MYTPDKIDSIAGTVLTVVALANKAHPRAGTIALLCVVLWLMQYIARHSPAMRDAWHALFDALRGIEPEPSSASGRAVAHHSEPLGQLSISVPVPETQAPPAYDATAAWLATAQQQTPTRATLTLAQALAHLNDRPDDVPHFFCLGGTGAGKSTFARLILSQRVQRGEQFLIMTGKRTSLFADVPCIGRDPIGADGSIRFNACRAACRALLSEVGRRDAMSISQRQFVPLSIVLDDASILLSEVNEAVELVRVVGLLGRELAMRLMILTGSLLLKELNLEGRGDLRDHFAVVDYRKCLDGRRQTELRLRYSEKDVYPFNAEQVPQFAPTMSIDPSRCWHPVVKVSSNLDTGITGNVPKSPVSVDTGISGIPDMGAVSAGINGGITGIDREMKILTMISWGCSANAIYAAVGGNRNDVLKLIEDLRKKVLTP